MKRTITYLRITAYLCGLTGLVLTLWSQSAGAGIVWLMYLSRGLLAVMFLLFISVYIVQALGRTARRRPPPREPPA